MNQKRILSFLMVAATVSIVACNSSGDKKTSTDSTGTQTTSGDNTASNNTSGSEKGVGKYQNVELTHPLDEKMVAAGKGVYDVKCSSCHKMTDEKLVGPGWKGVTDRRTPEWIMNFVTNTDEMIEKDPAAQKMLEECLVRMPNQSLSEQDARAVLEYMRSNDGKK
ncbi:MAG: cytochrome c [Chitinophagaceae bacterium]|nr:MAG: cytochrome c [Chitinophagaceae bacterium]